MDFYTVAIIQGLGYACMGLGIFISLRIFNIPDITTDGSFTLGGVVTAVALLAGVHPIITLILAASCGALSGIATGIIHTRLKVNALLSGILVMTALYSINLSIMQRSNLPLNDVYTFFDFTRVTGNNIYANLFSTTIVIALLLFLLTKLLQTDFGIGMRATGTGEQMARAFGVNTDKMKIIGLAIANALTALSGYLLVQYQGYSDINMGIGIVISGLAAVMIGEAIANLFSKQNIFIHILFVIAGSILFRLILAVALLAGLNPNYLKLVTSVIVLAVVVLTRFRKNNTC